jgi:hypothetical protein
MICKGRVVNEYVVPVVNATVKLTGGPTPLQATSDSEGNFSFLVTDAATYTANSVAFNLPSNSPSQLVEAGKDWNIGDLKITTGLLLSTLDENMNPTQIATADRRLTVRPDKGQTNFQSVQWSLRPEVQSAQPNGDDLDLIVPHGINQLYVEAIVTGQPVSIGGTGGYPTGAPTLPARTSVPKTIPVLAAPIQNVTVAGKVAVQEPVGIRLLRTEVDPTLDQSLWVAIRNRTRAVSFSRYQDFMNRALRFEERSYEVPRGVENPGAQARIEKDLKELGTDLHGVRAYQTLKLLTETFLLLECGVRIEPSGEHFRTPFDFGEETYRLGEPFTLQMMEERLNAYLGDRAQLPYITRVVRQAFPELEREGPSGRMIGARVNEPCLIELIWSYWMEEGMLVQTMNAVAQRFQNVRSGDRDVLQNLEIDPLRPLNNLLWGYVQDEFNRLTVRRRAYEYVHHYGLTLYGKATSGMHAADSRSKFLEAFHNLLYQASVFFKEDFQTTVIADGFPLLNALKEVHLILSQGAQNQFGDLPWTARSEMLLMQYMLGRREIRDFLQSRAMVPYKEPWEAQVDTMKGLQGWTDVTVTHFRDLAVYGEQLLLSIRYGDWIGVNDENSAKNWARYFRPEIQGYLHSYRAVTGIDLTNPDTVDATVPGILLRKRAANQLRAR